MPVGSRRALLSSVVLPAPPTGGGGGGGGPTSTLNPTTTPAPGTSSNISISAGNLQAAASSSAQGHATSLGVVLPGSLTYVEVTITNLVGTNGVAIGLCNSSKVLGPGGAAWAGGDPPNSMGVYDSQTIFLINNTNVNDPNLESFAGDTVGMEIDESAHKVRFRKGSYLSAAFDCPPGSIYLYVGLDITGTTVLVNTGASPFVYAAEISAGFIGRIT